MPICALIFDSGVNLVSVNTRGFQKKVTVVVN